MAAMRKLPFGEQNPVDSRDKENEAGVPSLSEMEDLDTIALNSEVEEHQIYDKAVPSPEQGSSVSLIKSQILSGDNSISSVGIQTDSVHDNWKIEFNILKGHQYSAKEGIYDDIAIHEDLKTSDQQEKETASYPKQSDVQNFKRMTRRFRSLSNLMFKRQTAECAKQDTSWWKTFVVAYQTLGIVYGDLGTSPLYVYPTINVDSPTELDYLGIMSLIFWTLTLIGLIKYVLIVMQADDHGEGGTFALYSLLCQHINIRKILGKQDSEHLKSDVRLSHFSKRERVQNRTKKLLESSDAAKKMLLFVVMLGTCMLIGDGILTPAISVLSAVSGIQSAASSISNTVVVVLSAVILVALFLFQRFGTKRVSFLFSPIMAAWLITTPIVGAYNIAVHYPKIFKSFSPHYIVLFFSKNGKKGWMMLGGIVLCITGTEAMFADMGHFDRRSIQVAFSTMVYPSVLLTYAGQSAYLIQHPDDHRDAFYKSIPHAVYWPIFVIATLAAVVASQGLISAAFSIIKQSVALDYFPRVKLVHTSQKKEGQIYSPEVNYILMILCLGVIFGFRGTNEIGNAFGVAVILVMLLTTVLITLVMLAIWETPLVLALSFLGLFGFIEGIYMTAVLVKIPQGGWLPFAVSLILVTVMLSWNYGRQKKCEYEMKHIISLQSLGTLLCNPEMHRVPGICFFYSDVLHGIPPIISHYVKIVKSLHQVLVFTTIRCLPVKTVLPHERFLMGGLGYKGVYRCIAQYGYKDIVDAEGSEFVDRIVATLTDYIKSQYSDTQCDEKWIKSEDKSSRNFAIATPELGLQGFAAEDLAELEMARQSGAVFVLGKARLKVGKNTRWLERIVMDKIYRFLQNNCRSAISTWKIPYSDSLEVGMLYEL